MIKILVASPTADVKSYCSDRWMDVATNLTYPNYDLYLCDNSSNRDYYAELKEKYKDDLMIERISTTHSSSVKESMAKSHEKCREKALRDNYDYLLHLETDVFPPLDVIERLLQTKKKVVGALYHIELGEESKLMVQQIEATGRNRETFNLDLSDLEFVDGTVKRVFSCGLGCVLIHKSVLQRVNFRYEKGAVVHPDSFFYGDLHKLNIPVFVDTSIYCKHDNMPLSRF